MDTVCLWNWILDILRRYTDWLLKLVAVLTAATVVGERAYRRGFLELIVGTLPAHVGEDDAQVPRASHAILDVVGLSER